MYWVNIPDVRVGSQEQNNPTRVISLRLAVVVVWSFLPLPPPLLLLLLLLLLLGVSCMVHSPLGSRINLFFSASGSLYNAAAAAVVVDGDDVVVDERWSTVLVLAVYLQVWM